MKAINVRGRVLGAMVVFALALLGGCSSQQGSGSSAQSVQPQPFQIAGVWGNSQGADIFEFRSDGSLRYYNPIQLQQAGKYFKGTWGTDSVAGRTIYHIRLSPSELTGRTPYIDASVIDANTLDTHSTVYGFLQRR